MVGVAVGKGVSVGSGAAVAVGREVAVGSTDGSVGSGVFWGEQAEIRHKTSNNTLVRSNMKESFSTLILPLLGKTVFFGWAIVVIP